MCHLFFRFANIRGPNDGHEMFLFKKTHGIKMNNVFSYINLLDMMLKSKYDELYDLNVPVNSLDDMDSDDDNINSDDDDEIYDCKNEDIDLIDEDIKSVSDVTLESENCHLPIDRFTCKICGVKFKSAYKCNRHLNNKNLVI